MTSIGQKGASVSSNYTATRVSDSITTRSPEDPGQIMSTYENSLTNNSKISDAACRYLDDPVRYELNTIAQIDNHPKRKIMEHHKFLKRLVLLFPDARAELDLDR